MEENARMYAETLRTFVEGGTTSIESILGSFRFRQREKSEERSSVLTRKLKTGR